MLKSSAIIIPKKRFFISILYVMVSFPVIFLATNVNAVDSIQQSNISLYVFWLMLKALAWALNLEIQVMNDCFP